ncbi:MAG: hypothetical protein LLG05_13045 [Porphyromonadaceae bacterium]|nr:hypothetical protein [Porphyromonadaceae bacterium]
MGGREMNNPSGKILLELLLSPDTPSELFGKYKKQLLSCLAAGEEAIKRIAELEKEVERIRDAMERLKYYNRKLLDDCIKMDNEISVLKADKL